MVTKSNYEKKEVSICLSVIVEVMTILGDCFERVAALIIKLGIKEYVESVDNL